jgi:hypothetical protein
VATPFTCTINLQIQKVDPLSVGSHFEAHLTLGSWFSHPPFIFFISFFYLSLSPPISLRQSPSSQSFMAALTSATMFRSQKRELVTRGSRSGFCCWGRKFRGTPPCSGLSTSRRKCRQRLSTFGVPTGAGGDVF